MRPGTWVVLEGPYGAFTRHARSTESVALIGAGVGLTPLRALLEDLPPWVDVTVLVRGSTEDAIVHRHELVAMVEGRRGRFHQLIGPREHVRLDTAALRRLVPDIAHRDVYVCGPEGFNDSVVGAASRLGTPPERIHRETFAL